MKKLFITRKNLEILIQGLKKDCDEFIAPKKEHLDDIVFGDTKNDGVELLDYGGNSVISPRAYLLPQTEQIFEIKSAAKNELVPVEDKKRRIFYGIRPCDIKALELMQEFFIQDFTDAFYLQKLQMSVFIALSCNKPCSEKCFCYEMDAGPVAKDGFDLQLAAVTDGFIVEAGSKAGRGIINNSRDLFSKIGGKYAKEAEENLNIFSEGKRTADHRKIAKAIKQDKIKSAVWDDIGQRCVVCSGCITLCPTCSCFSIADRLSGLPPEANPDGYTKDAKGGDTGARFRYCDGCVFAGFTRMAGGNTPFPLHKDHIRRFFEHKLNIDVQRYGSPSCVGCGRCIQTCPGNISIRKFIEEAV